MKIPRRYQARIIGFSLFVVLMCAIWAIAVTYDIGPIPQTAESRQAYAVTVRGEVAKVIEGSCSYHEDLSSIATVKNALLNCRVTTEELGYHEDLFDPESSKTWVRRMRGLAIVNEAHRAIARIVETQERIAAEQPVKDKSGFSKLQQYRKGNREEVTNAERDLIFIYQSVDLVTQESLSLTFGPVPGDTRTIEIEQPGIPYIAMAQEYAKSIKTGIPPYYDWSPVD